MTAKTNSQHASYRLELRIARKIRQEHALTGNYFATDGSFVLADPAAARSLAFKLNAGLDADRHVYPGELYAAGLLHEIYHVLVRQYEKAIRKDVFDEVATFLEQKTGKAAFRSMMLEFTEHFPPARVYSGQLSAAQHLAGTADGRSGAAIGTEELMITTLANENPASKNTRMLFDMQTLPSAKRFMTLTEAMENAFRELPPFGPGNMDLFTLLRTPFSYDNYDAQLEYVLQNWQAYLPEELIQQILKGRDLMKEDYRLAGGFGPPPAIAPDYKGQQTAGMGLGKSGFDPLRDAHKDYEEPEHFTDDTDWMPRVVLMAKNTYVWLDQLSKQYRREIRRLDQIPDEELDLLAGRNFNGLWLIGLWERSTASKKIKHKMGHGDAVSSAYSLYDYQIAHDLGGEEAYRTLNEKARQRGIRLASDMVPNHTGVFSKWVIERPDFFIQSAVPPFPAYRFTGDNLSDHPNVEIRIEDGYYSKSDAAVVFQRIDRQNNDIRYIYHGNDGTMMPWNDTAQLDMIKSEVREAVIEKIFDVARKFSIIRFDAAMTLAKKHFARLWYPRPGTGGDIPSRADHAMSQEAFDQLFPKEFWREVVDRINNEMPETLLLAEAFWFMEGYFVRTLGMHRVYNSAFMHMLKNEENEKYRELITNTLEFEPEILKRYVNFMSNPDEETAIQQFGTGDKYFGVCVLMNTLPGLPMFAHGQVEGYTEKYGMEYQRAYYNEEPNNWLVEKHMREIFPLTHKRYLFSDVKHFNIFGFSDHHGIVNENVFAFTNRYGHERALVFFNNKYEMAKGHIKTSAPRLQKDVDQKRLLSVTLGDALNLKQDPHAFYVCREHISGQEYLLSGDDLHHHGFYRELMGFEYRVFIDFREMYDTDGSVATLCDQLEWQGVPSVSELLTLKRLEGIHLAFKQALQTDYPQALISSDVVNEDASEHSKAMGKSIAAFESFAGEALAYLGVQTDSKDLSQAFSKRLPAMPAGLSYMHASHPYSNKIRQTEHIDTPDLLLMYSRANNYRENSLLLMAVYAIESVAELIQDKTTKESFYDTLMLRKPLEELLAQFGKSHSDIAADLQLTEVLLRYGGRLYDFGAAQLQQGENIEPPLLSKKAALALDILADPQVKTCLGVNLYDGIWYYSKESFEQLNKWFFTLAVNDYLASDKAIKDKQVLEEAVYGSLLFYEQATRLSSDSGYDLKNLTDSLSKLASQ